MKKLLILCLLVLATFLACNGSTPEAADPWADGKIYAGAEIGFRADTTQTLYVRFEEDDIFIGYDVDNMEGRIAKYKNQISTTERTETMWRMSGVNVDNVIDSLNRKLQVYVTVEKNDDGTINYTEDISYYYEDALPHHFLSHEATLTEYTTSN